VFRTHDRFCVSEFVLDFVPWAFIGSLDNINDPVCGAVEIHPQRDPFFHGIIVECASIRYGDFSQLTAAAIWFGRVVQLIVDFVKKSAEDKTTPTAVPGRVPSGSVGTGDLLVDVDDVHVLALIEDKARLIRLLVDADARLLSYEHKARFGRTCACKSVRQERGSAQTKRAKFEEVATGKIHQSRSSRLISPTELKMCFGR